MENKVEMLPLNTNTKHALNIEKWSVDDVERWISTELNQGIANKFKKHKISGKHLFALSISDLKDIGIKNVGDRHTLTELINKKLDRGKTSTKNNTTEPYALLPDIKRAPRQAIVKFLLHGSEFLHAPIWRQILLALAGGAYVAFGAALSVVLSAGVDEPGPKRLLTSLGFVFGFSLIILSGSALFTEINIVLPVVMLFRWREYRRFSLKCLRFWGLVYVCNVLGALFVAFILWTMKAFSKDSLDRLEDITFKKLEYEKDGVGGWFLMVISGIVANWFVGIAALLAQTARSLTSKVIAVFGPITMFVSLGSNHSPANMGYLFLALMENKGQTNLGKVLVWNIIPSSIGNLLGGMILVAFFYWAVFTPPKHQLISTFPQLRRKKSKQPNQVVVSTEIGPNNV